MSRVPMINLLPWRQLRQIRQNEQFRRALFGTVLASLAVIGALYAYQKHRFDHQQAINDDIKARMTALDGDIAQIAALENEQKALFEKVALIHDLGENRAAMVRLFESLAKMSDGLVYFTQINHAGESLTITGVAKESALVSRFSHIIAAQSTPIITDAMVTSLQESPDGAWVNFVMSAKLDLNQLEDDMNNNRAESDADDKAETFKNNDTDKSISSEGNSP